jgi:hypothetical protein
MSLPVDEEWQLRNARSDDELHVEGDGSLDAWLVRARDPRQFVRDVRVRTSPKRPEDPIDYGTCTTDARRRGDEWVVRVRWDNEIRNIGMVVGGYGSRYPEVDLRSIVPLTTY